VLAVRYAASSDLNAIVPLQTPWCGPTQRQVRQQPNLIDAMTHDAMLWRSEMPNDLFSSGFRVVLGGRGASTASNLIDAMSHDAAI
jgi:hypothetical protein